MLISDWSSDVCSSDLRMRANLQALSGLYRQLEDVLQPGRRGGDGRSATRTAPIPCSLDAVDLRARGGIEGVVGGWARDLCERENWNVRSEERRVGQEGGRTCRFRGAPDHIKKK